MKAISSIRKATVASYAALLPLAVGCWTLGTGSAGAQSAAAVNATAGSDSDQNNLNEIVVTAQRREEKLIDVPVAITVVTQSDINRYNSTSLPAIADMVPQVMVTPVANNGAAFTIRGIGPLGGDPGLEQSVAVNVDDVQIDKGRIGEIAFFDLQQVEVLEGPQALFFGKNSPGGVISVTSASPTNQFDGSFRSGYEFTQDEQRFVEGVVSGPIVDGFGGRLAVRAEQSAGYLTNNATAMADPIPGLPAISPGAANQNQIGDTSVVGRATLKYDDGGPFTAVLKTLFNHSDANGQVLDENKCLGAHPVVEFLGVTYTEYESSCQLGQYRTSSSLTSAYASDPTYSPNRSGAPYEQDNQVQTSFVMNLNLGHIKLTAVTGYYWYNDNILDDFGMTEFMYIHGNLHQVYNLLSQEVRVNTDFDSPVNFAGGVYLEHEHRYDLDGNGFWPGYDPVAKTWYTNWQDGVNRGNTYSGFGQVIWKIIPNLELAGGARYTKEEKFASLTGLYVNEFQAVAGGQLPVGTVLTGNYAEHNVSPEATLTWHPEEFLMAYAAFKTGYQAGGYASTLTSFKSEQARGFEIGTKTTLDNNRLQIQADVYEYKYDNLQVSTFDPATVSFDIGNAASARTTGAELAAHFKATRDLALRLSAGYNRARYINAPGLQCWPGQTAAQGCLVANDTQNLAGQPLTRAPDFNGNVGATYDVPLPNSLSLEFAGDVFYTTSYWTQPDLTPTALQPSFARVNASITLLRSRWSLSLMGTNLTNKWYGTESYDAPFGGPEQVDVTVAPPREVRLVAAYHFGNSP
jgi:iron complex outermembrane recepter protein